MASAHGKHQFVVYSYCNAFCKKCQYFNMFFNVHCTKVSINKFVHKSKKKKKSEKVLLQEGRPLPGPESGFLSNTWNELSEETHVLTKQEILLGRDVQTETCRVREPRRTALTCSFLFYVNGISFWVIFSQSFWLIVLPGGSGKMDASKKNSGRWSDMWCLLLTFPELFWLAY